MNHALHPTTQVHPTPITFYKSYMFCSHLVRLGGVGWLGGIGDLHP